MLHVTNGDAAAELIFKSDLKGPVLPWRDVLTDGPVPGGADAAAFRETRGAFLEAAYDDDTATETLAERDSVLVDAAAGNGEITLWFEHDLYDQLQLIQVLEMLRRTRSPRTKVSLICIDRHPAIERFLGLGQLSPNELAALFPSRRAVGKEMFTATKIGWRAFTAADPGALNHAVVTDLSALPFLRPALLRWCQEFPWTSDGLTLTERMALEAIGGGEVGPVDIFKDHYEREAAPFLGDWGFWVRLEQLLKRDVPLIDVQPGPGFAYPPKVEYGRGFDNQRFRLTDHGRRILDGYGDAISAGDPPRWFGGYKLDPGSEHWRWDPESERLVPFGV